MIGSLLTLIADSRTFLHQTQSPIPNSQSPTCKVNPPPVSQVLAIAPTSGLPLPNTSSATHPTLTPPYLSPHSTTLPQSLPPHLLHCQHHPLYSTVTQEEELIHTVHHRSQLCRSLLHAWKSLEYCGPVPAGEPQSPFSIRHPTVKLIQTVHNTTGSVMDHCQWRVSC